MKIRFAAVAIVAMLALTGCTDEVSSPATDDQPVAASQQRTVEETPAVAESPEPVVAETPHPSAQPSDDAEAAFLTEVRDRLAKIRTQIPDVTDEQLLTIAHDACARLDSGESGEDMTLIEGEQVTHGYYMDSGAIIIAARLTMCPIS